MGEMGCWKLGSPSLRKANPTLIITVTICASSMPVHCMQGPCGQNGTIEDSRRYWGKDPGKELEWNRLNKLYKCLQSKVKGSIVHIRVFGTLIGKRLTYGR